MSTIIKAVFEPISSSSQAISNYQYGCTAEAEILFTSPQAALEATTVPEPAPLPTIFIVGYTYRGSLQPRSMVSNFADIGLPFLIAHRTFDLVLEILPYGRPADRIEQEIIEFNRSGNIGQEMYQFIRVADRPLFEYLLIRAHQLGIRIHSGGVNYENAQATILNRNFINSPERLAAAAREIRRNSEARIRELADAGKRVASFGGSAHANPFPNRENAGISFVPSLAHDYGVRVRIINLVDRALSQSNNSFKHLGLRNQLTWENLVPRKHYNLVRLSCPNSYLLFWPSR